MITLTEKLLAFDEQICKRHTVPVPARAQPEPGAIEQDPDPNGHTDYRRLVAQRSGSVFFSLSRFLVFVTRRWVRDGGAKIKRQHFGKVNWLPFGKVCPGVPSATLLQRVCG